MANTIPGYGANMRNLSDIQYDILKNPLVQYLEIAEVVELELGKRRHFFRARVRKFYDDPVVITSLTLEKVLKELENYIC